MLLPPELVALLAVVHARPGVAEERYAWYIQTFNIGNYTIGDLATWAAAALLAAAGRPVPDDHLRFAVAGSPPVWSPSRLNHVAARADAHARPRALAAREPGSSRFESLSTDLILATLGLAVAALWSSTRG